MLRQTLCAAAVALATGPALAGDPLFSSTSLTAADVSIAGGYFSGGGGTGEAVVNGRVNIPFGAAWNEEVEAAGLWEFNGSYTAIGAFSHTYYKNANWAGGFLLGATSLDGDGVFTAGVEGAIFRTNSTYLGHISRSWMSANLDFWTIAAEARCYFTPNDKLTAKAVWSNFAGDSDWMLQGAYEHRWTGSRLSAFASLAFFPLNSNWEGLVGVRASFDQPGSTIQSHDFEVPFEAARDISY